MASMSISSEAQEFESTLAAILNKEDGLTIGEKHESFKRNNAKNPIPEIRNSKKRQEQEMEGVHPIPEINRRLVVGKAKKVAKNPTEKNPKATVDMDQTFLVKKTKMAFDVKKKAPEKAKEKNTKVVPKSPVKKTKAAEKAKKKKTKAAAMSPEKKSKAAEKAKEKKTQVVSKSPTKKTKMAADVKKTAAEKAKEKKNAKVAAKKKTNANSDKKTQAKKPKTVKSQY